MNVPRRYWADDCQQMSHPKSSLPMRHAIVLTVLVACAACSSTTRTSTGRTEHETDSVIGQSAVPGAPVVKKALDMQDSSRARVAAMDSTVSAEP